MNKGHKTIRARWLTCILIMMIIAMSGAVFLLPGAGAAGGTLPDYYINPQIIRPTIPSIVLDPYELRVTLTLDSDKVSTNAPTMLDATVTYSNGTPAMGATITLTAAPSGIYFEKSVFKAVSSNTFITKFQAPDEGTYTITATATLDGYTADTSAKTVSIMAPLAPVTATPTTEPITPTPAIVPGGNNTTVAGGFDLGGLGPALPYVALVGGILLIVLILLAYLWLKRSLRLEPKKMSAPCDGKSVIPVRVSFVNGFGMVRHAKADMEISLETTAGSIQSVVLQNGRDFMDATLTTAKEFGPVTITGRFKNKSASAKVNFTYGHASLDISAVPTEIPADGSSTSAVTVRIKDEGGNFISPLEDLAVELKATLGKIPANIRVPARTAEVPVAYTAADQSGTAVITALSGSLKGEAKIALQGIPKRFCMHCGVSMSMEASMCPKCGLTPPSGVDTKPCSTCGTVLPEPGKFCYQCGARQPEMAKAQQPVEPAKR